MRSADRSDWQRKNSLTPLAIITKHKKYQTDNGGSGWMDAPGSPVTPTASLCVSRDVQGLRQVTLRQALSSTQISVSLLHTAFCQLRCALCEERAELSVVTSDSPRRLYISAYIQVSRSPLSCTYFPCTAQCTIHTTPVQYSKPHRKFKPLLFAWHTKTALNCI